MYQSVYMYKYNLHPMLTKYGYIHKPV